MAHTQSGYTGRDPEHGCWCCFADGLTVSKSLAPSVAQATHALVCFNLLISSKVLPAFRHDLTDQIPLNHFETEELHACGSAFSK